MKNFFQKTFQPKKELKPVQNISKEKKVIKESFQKKSEPIKDKKDIKIKPKISQEIMNANLSVLGLIGILPLISTIVYLWLMNIKNIIKFKYLIIFTMILWFIYDFSIKSYSSAVFDLMTVIANMYSIIKIIAMDNKGV